MVESGPDSSSIVVGKGKLTSPVPLAGKMTTGGTSWVVMATGGE